MRHQLLLSLPQSALKAAEIASVAAAYVYQSAGPRGYHDATQAEIAKYREMVAPVQRLHVVGAIVSLFLPSACR